MDEITSIVEDLTQEEKVEILQQMKQLINDNEQGAKDLLMENPQLAQALLLIQMSFDLVKADDIRQLTEDANPTAATNLRPTPVFIHFICQKIKIFVKVANMYKS